MPFLKYVPGESSFILDAPPPTSVVVDDNTAAASVDDDVIVAPPPDNFDREAFEDKEDGFNNDDVVASLFSPSDVKEAVISPQRPPLFPSPFL